MNKDNLVRSLHLSPFKESLLKKAKRGEYIDLVELREPNEEHEQIETSFKGANGEALIFSRKGSKNTQKVTSYIEWVKLSTALYNLYKEAGQHKLNESGLRHFFFCQTLDKYTWESIIAYDEAVRRAKPQGPWDQYLESVACRKLKLLDRNKINLKKRKGRNYEEEDRVVLPCFFFAANVNKKGCTRRDCRFKHYCPKCKISRNHKMQDCKFEELKTAIDEWKAKKKNKTT